MGRPAFAQNTDSNPAPLNPEVPARATTHAGTFECIGEMHATDHTGDAGLLRKLQKAQKCVYLKQRAADVADAGISMTHVAWHMCGAYWPIDLQTRASPHKVLVQLLTQTLTTFGCQIGGSTIFQYSFLSHTSPAYLNVVISFVFPE